MKASEVLAALTDLSYAFPNTKLPTDRSGLEGVARVWHGALGDLEGEYVAMAVSQHIRTEKWFPAPAEIRQAAIRFKVGLPEPANAWLDAQRAAGSRDRAQYENMHNVALMALRDIGGPGVINNATDLPRVREQYMKAYDARVNEVYIAPGLVYANPGITAAEAMAAVPLMARSVRQASTGSDNS